MFLRQTGESTCTSLPPVVQEDCLPYTPNALRLVNEGAGGWLLTDGTSRMLVLDNESDAQRALTLARSQTAHCFIGRNNGRPNRLNYIVEYWKGGAGVPSLPGEDCLPYNRTALRLVDEGPAGWLLTDGGSRMLTLDNRADAERALALARAASAQCFIGRNNTRANRRSYIVGYWR